MLTTNPCGLLHLAFAESGVSFGLKNYLAHSTLSGDSLSLGGNSFVFFPGMFSTKSGLNLVLCGFTFLLDVCFVIGNNFLFRSSFFGD